MKNHYYTSEHTILCNQKHKHLFKASARFDYKIGVDGNCKKCDKILTEHGNQSKRKCMSSNKLGYYIECQWRNEDKCKCIDDCIFKF